MLFYFILAIWGRNDILKNHWKINICLNGLFTSEFLNTDVSLAKYTRELFGSVPYLLKVFFMKDFSLIFDMLIKC
jgi:hypothetical protein